MFWPFKKRLSEAEALILDSLDNDVWSIVQGTGGCSNHVYFRHNDVELSLAYSEEYGWQLFEAKVCGQKIKKYESIRRKCSEIAQTKFGTIDLISLLKRELNR